MPLRQIARTIYQLQQEVERLRQALDRSAATDREASELKLARAIAERDRMKQVLDGHLDR